MAQKKGGGSTRNGRDSQPKTLGVEAFGGKLIRAGSIIVRRARHQVPPRHHVGMGKDHTSVRAGGRPRAVQGQGLVEQAHGQRDPGGLS